MRDRFGARNPKSLMLRFHTQTAGVQLTAQQPEVNLVRVTLQALAAVLGGTQSLHTNSFDEAIALPTAKAARLALRTQQVLAYETDLTKTVDPFAGSYAVESLTDDLEAEIAAADGSRSPSGAARSRRSSRVSRRARSSGPRTRSPRQIDRGERVVVGVNRFALDEEEPYAPLRVDPAIEAEQVGAAGRAAAPPRRRRGRRGSRPRSGRPPRGTANVLAAAEAGAGCVRDRRRGL